MTERDLRRRIDEIRAVAAEHLQGPVLDSFGAMICDGCGLTVRLDPEAKAGALNQQFQGWGKGPLGDLCPACMTAWTKT